MFFSFKALSLAFFFLAGMEIFIFGDVGWQLVSFFILGYSIFGVWKLRKKLLTFVTPALFVFSSLALLFLISSKIERQIFVFLSGGLYYLILLGIYRLGLYEKDQTARGMIAASSTATLFFFYTSIYGIYLNYDVGIFSLMLAFFLTTFLISSQYFSLIQESKKNLLLYSLVLAFCMAEIAWVINFWPFGYLTSGVIVLIFYYIIWDLAQSYFLNILSKKRVVANLIFFGLLAFLVLASSRWLPIV